MTSNLKGGNSHQAILEDIVDEIVQQFSTQIIYLGNGDTDGSRATACISCLPRVAEGSQVDALEPHNATVLGLEEYLKPKGAQLLVWESAIRAGIEKETAVLAWHETEEGLQATKMGYNVVMSPATYFSLDYYQSNPTVQAEAMSGFLPLEMLYNYNPLTTEGVGQVLGVQSSMWTKYTNSLTEVEEMLYPRLLAAAEVAWSVPKRKSYRNFKERALKSSAHLRSKGYSVFDLELEQVIRPESTEPVVSIAKNCPVTYNSLFDDRFPAGGSTALTDGERGGWAYTDGRWQGYQNKNIDVTIDLGSKRAIKHIESVFLYDRLGSIYAPYHVEILGSDDGNSYHLIGDVASPIGADKAGYTLVPFAWNGEEQTRYVRFIAKYSGPADGWLFTDEIIIR